MQLIAETLIDGDKLEPNSFMKGGLGSGLSNGTAAAFRRVKIKIIIFKLKIECKIEEDDSVL